MWSRDRGNTTEGTPELQQEVQDEELSALCKQDLEFVVQMKIKKGVKWSGHPIYKATKKDLKTQTDHNKSGRSFLRAVFTLNSLLMHWFIIKFVPSENNLRSFVKTPEE